MRIIRVSQTVKRGTRSWPQGKKRREVIAALAVFSSGKHGLCILRASATSVREQQRGVVEAGFKRMLRERERESGSVIQM